MQTETLNIAPTPWRVGPVDDTVVSAADRSVVATIDGDYNHPDTWPIMEANARLIAAAPELLEPAEDAIEILQVAIDLWNEVYPHEQDEVFSDLQQRFRAAIAKATRA